MRVPSKRVLSMRVTSSRVKILRVTMVFSAVFIAVFAATIVGVPSLSGVVPAQGSSSEQALTPLTIGRLQYGGGGDWYANPTSLPNLLEAIRTWTGIPTALSERTVRPLDPDLWRTPFLHMTGHGEVRFTPEERVALRRHLEGGGFLHADDNYGMDAAFRREVALLFPDQPLVELPSDHPIFRMVFAFPDGLPKIHEHDGRPPSAWGIFHRGRLVLVYTHETDLGNGWEDPEVHHLPEPLRRDALRMGVNLFVYALSGVVS